MFPLFHVLIVFMMMLSMFEAVLYIVDAASYIIELCLSALVAPHALLQRLLIIGNESVPIQLAQCWFHALAISNAKI